MVKTPDNANNKYDNDHCGSGRYLLIKNNHKPC